MKKTIVSVLCALFAGSVIGAISEADLPDVSTLDPNWAKGALKINEWGWYQLAKGEDIRTQAFNPQQPGASLALP